MQLRRVLRLQVHCQSREEKCFPLFCSFLSSLQCSCLENPRDGGAWWAAVYGLPQNRTRLKRLSSSSRQSFGQGKDYRLPSLLCTWGQALGRWSWWERLKLARAYTYIYMASYGWWELFCPLTHPLPWSLRLICANAGDSWHCPQFPTTSRCSMKVRAQNDKCWEMISHFGWTWASGWYSCRFIIHSFL